MCDSHPPPSPVRFHRVGRSATASTNNLDRPHAPTTTPISIHPPCPSLNPTAPYQPHPSIDPQQTSRRSNGPETEHAHGKRNAPAIGRDPLDIIEGRGLRLARVLSCHHGSATGRRGCCSAPTGSTDEGVCSCGEGREGTTPSKQAGAGGSLLACLPPAAPRFAPVGVMWCV